MLALTKGLVHVNIFPAWQGSSVEEQETHKLLVVGSIPTLATLQKKPVNFLAGFLVTFFGRLILCHRNKIELYARAFGNQLNFSGRGQGCPDVEAIGFFKIILLNLENAAAIPMNENQITDIIFAIIALSSRNLFFIEAITGRDDDIAVSIDAGFKVLCIVPVLNANIAALIAAVLSPVRSRQFESGQFL